MVQAVEAYRHVSATKEFQELERLRFLATCNEASALGNARRKIAKNLLADGMSVENVARATELTVDNVLKLKQI